MAKQKRSAADLDEELEALEAELAALEGKPRKAKKAPKPAPAPKPAEAKPDEAADEPKAKRGRFSLPFGRKKAPAEPADVPEPEQPAPAETPVEGPPAVAEPEPPAAVESAAVEPAPAASAMPSPPSLPTFDPSVWRHEEGAWVRTVPDTPVPVIRRVVDENGELVREEPANQQDVDEVTGVKAERGLGRFLRRKG